MKKIIFVSFILFEIFSSYTDFVYGEEIPIANGGGVANTPILRSSSVADTSRSLYMPSATSSTPPTSASTSSDSTTSSTPPTSASTSSDSTTSSTPTSATTSSDSTTSSTPTSTTTSSDSSSSQVAAPEMSDNKSVNDAYNKFLNEPSDANEAAYKNALSDAKQEAADADPNNIAGKGFKFGINDLSPAKTKWTSGPSGNTNKLLGDIVRYLLIGITSFAALFMVVGGIKIITAGGESSEIQNGKKIITYNIIAIVVSLLSYSIINLVTWVLSSAA